MNRKIADFSGKTIFVGIDVHKVTYSIYCVLDGVMVKKATVPASPSGLSRSLLSLFPGAEVCSAYEAGFSGFVLHRTLMRNGIRNIVVNPSSIEIAAKDKVKTDRRDCMKIAIQLSAGRLTGIAVPSEEQEQARLITRTREQLVNERVRLGHQFKNRLYQFGLISYDDRSVASKSFIERYLQRDLPRELKQSLQSLAKIWRVVSDEISVLDKVLSLQAAKDKNEIIYRTVPGVGPLSSRILSNELGDMRQFRNERAVFSHTGLTPSEFSSGPYRRQGHISRQGSARIRWVLTEIAWRAIRKDVKLAADFQRIAMRAGKKRAIVAIARKIVGRIRTCVLKGVPYELNYLPAA